MRAAYQRTWTEEEFCALPETKPKLELFDGVMVRQASPTYRHQDLGAWLWRTLFPAARAAGLWIYLDVSVRLRPERIVAPDLLIRPRVTDRAWLQDVAPVRLAGEILSTDRRADTVRKMRYYAEAGIPRYLIVDPEGPTLALYRLDGGHYVEEATAGPGQVLRFTEPIATDLDPATLLPED